MSQWVQHISGQGEKWQVANEYARSWDCTEQGKGTVFYLPKSEYVLCDPPERWVDITNECDVSCSDDKQLRWKLTDRKGLNLEQCGPTFENLPNFACRENRYRLRKVELFKRHSQYNDDTTQAAFIVERKEP